MKRILIVLLVAACGAIFLWVLAEFEGEPISDSTPSPIPDAPTATVAAIIIPIPSRTPPGPTTGYSDPAFYVSAQLPGKEWSPSSSAPAGPSVWLDKAAGLAFGVEDTGQYPAASDAELEEHATRFAKNSLARYTIDKEAFHGIDAYRLEGLGGPGPFEDFHCIGFIYSLHGREYVLRAGAQIAVWDAAHRSMIGSILDSVQFK